ncbi:4997_t:CDS:2, partial [Funneliformis geosporum]
KKFSLYKVKFLDRLNLDEYNEELRLAFKFQGSQHYYLNSIFHRRGKIDLDEQRIHDKKKQDICKQEANEGNTYSPDWPFHFLVTEGSHSEK